MSQVKVFVTLKPTILDAQGQVVRQALERLGHTNVDKVRVGKYLELEVTPNGRPLEEQVREMCDALLANPVMEDYSFQVVE